jgi:hypothetical protein
LLKKKQDDIDYEESAMCLSCQTHIAGVWLHLTGGQQFRTPDDLTGVHFKISHVDPEKIKIKPQGIAIRRQAFENALHYLRDNHHYLNNPIEIRSNNDRTLAGSLCVASRGK